MSCGWKKMGRVGVSGVTVLMMAEDRVLGKIKG